MKPSDEPSTKQSNGPCWAQTWQSIVKSYAIDFESLTFGLSIIVSPYWSVAVLAFSKIKRRSIRSMIPLQHKPHALGALYCNIRSVCNFAGIVGYSQYAKFHVYFYFFLLHWPSWPNMTYIYFTSILRIMLLQLLYPSRLSTITKYF